MVDWGSVLLFAVTTVAGGGRRVLRHGAVPSRPRADGGPISRSVERLGRISFAMLGAWFAFFLLLGGYAVGRAVMRKEPVVDGPINTTGMKLWFGMSAGAYAAAVLYGWTSGGVDWGLFPGHLGDLWFQALGAVTLGYKGAVGDHVGYGLLLAFSACSFVLGVLMVITRDGEGDTLEQAPLDDGPAALGDPAPLPGPIPVRLPRSSPWPLTGAVAVTLVAVGSVLDRFVVLAGLGLLAVVAVGWLEAAQADRVAGMARSVSPPMSSRPIRCWWRCDRAGGHCSGSGVQPGGDRLRRVRHVRLVDRPPRRAVAVIALGFGILIRSAVEAAVSGLERRRARHRGGHHRLIWVVCGRTAAQLQRCCNWASSAVRAQATLDPDRAHRTAADGRRLLVAQPEELGEHERFALLPGQHTDHALHGGVLVETVALLGPPNRLQAFEQRTAAHAAANLGGAGVAGDGQHPGHEAPAVAPVAGQRP
ncbi:MAG: hypothetical protein R2749_26180 [Acidimicrobiales bacterium]